MFIPPLSTEYTDGILRPLQGKANVTEVNGDQLRRGHGRAYHVSKRAASFKFASLVVQTGNLSKQAGNLLGLLAIRGREESKLNA